MKKNLRGRFYMVSCLAVFIFTLFPGHGADIAGAVSIVNSVHNLSVTGPGTIKALTETRVCVFCHTPHTAQSVAPLWNHTMSPAATTYQLYSSATLLSPTSPAIQPDHDSKLCLACHDGTVALGSVVNVGGAASTITMQSGVTTMPAGSSNLGTDLSGHHPISIEMNSQLVADKFTQCQGGTVTWKLCMPPAGSAVILRPTDNTYGTSSPPHMGVQCTSCHNPHDPGDGSNTDTFLRIGTAAYTDPLCTVCHVDCFSTCP